ncbi:condensation domain-containing protein, partial [Paenibacillus sp. JCM 10914]|uniref:condensation domain-containing protein n=1 Tax=Paenibacillus sp. JCM 10914 TaxID=1236974 RepID=UPI000AAF469C
YVPRIEKTERVGHMLPLSFAQQRLWFLDRLLPDRALYNIPGALYAKGELDAEVLRQSLADLVERHEGLRSTFTDVDGKAMQVIHEEMAIALGVSDLHMLGEEAKQEAVKELARADARMPFDLEQGPLLRTHLVQLAEEEHIILFNMHHIVSDGWSMGIFLRELRALYEA